MKELEQNLRDFANIIEADEVLLFERATFLVISHYCIRQHRDVNRFEKVSNIIKQFKLSCRLVHLLYMSCIVNEIFVEFVECRNKKGRRMLWFYFE